MDTFVQLYSAQLVRKEKAMRWKRSLTWLSVFLCLLIGFVGWQSCAPQMKVGKRNPVSSMLAAMPSLGDSGPQEPGLFPGTGPWQSYPRIQNELLQHCSDMSGNQSTFLTEDDYQRALVTLNGPDLTLRVYAGNVNDRLVLYPAQIWDTHEEAVKATGRHYLMIDPQWRDQVWRETVTSAGAWEEGSTIYVPDEALEKSYSAQGGKKRVMTYVIKAVPTGEYLVDAGGAGWYAVQVR